MSHITIQELKVEKEQSVLQGYIKTKAAMISGGHLVGAGKVMEFIDSNGRIDSHDDNMMTCSKYMKKFGDHTIDYTLRTAS